MLGDAPTAHEVFIERFSKSSSPGSVARNQRLRADGSLHFRAEIALFGNNCSPVVPQRLFSGLPKSTDISSHGRLCETWNHNGYRIRATPNVTGARKRRWFTPHILWLRNRRLDAIIGRFLEMPFVREP